MADVQCIAQPFMKTAWHAFNGSAMWVELVYFLIVFLEEAPLVYNPYMNHKENNLL